MSAGEIAGELLKGEEKVLGQTFIETEEKHQHQQSAVGHDFEARRKSLSSVQTDPLHPVYTGTKARLVRL